MRWLESNDLGLVLVALIGLIGSWFGGSRIKDTVTGGSQATPQSSEKTYEIAGAIISDKKANEIVAAIDRLAGQLEKNTNACTEMTHRIEPLPDVIRDLAKEYEFASRRGRGHD